MTDIPPNLLVAYILETLEVKVRLHGEVQISLLSLKRACSFHDDVEDIALMVAGNRPVKRIEPMQQIEEFCAANGLHCVVSPDREMMAVRMKSPMETREVPALTEEEAKPQYEFNPAVGHHTTEEDWRYIQRVLLERVHECSNGFMCKTGKRPKELHIGMTESYALGMQQRQELERSTRATFDATRPKEFMGMRLFEMPVFSMVRCAGEARTYVRPPINGSDLIDFRAMSFPYRP